MQKYTDYFHIYTSTFVSGTLQYFYGKFLVRLVAIRDITIKQVWSYSTWFSPGFHMLVPWPRYISMTLVTCIALALGHVSSILGRTMQHGMSFIFSWPSYLLTYFIRFSVNNCQIFHTMISFVYSDLSSVDRSGGCNSRRYGERGRQKRQELIGIQGSPQHFKCLFLGHGIFHWHWEHALHAQNIPWLWAMYHQSWGEPWVYDVFCHLGRVQHG